MESSPKIHPPNFWYILNKSRGARGYLSYITDWELTYVGFCKWIKFSLVNFNFQLCLCSEDTDTDNSTACMGIQSTGPKIWG